MPHTSIKNAILAMVTGLLCSSGSYGQSSCAACNDAAVNFDKASGLCLPASIKGFDTATFSEVQVSAMKAFRNTVVAGYNETGHRLAITVYIYDREESGEAADTKEVRSAVSEILAAHRGAQMAAGGKSSFILGNESVTAQGGLFTWREGQDEYASFLWVVPRERRFVKVRTTYVRPNGGEAEAMKFAKESAHKVGAEICSAH